jgi:alkylation response protein AidB-like acyl-CoA dehydrogenase
MESKILSRRDLDFLLYEWLDVEALTGRTRYADHARETFDAALDTAQRMATELFAPHNRRSDAHEPTFDGVAVSMIPEVKTALDAYAAAGLIAAGQDIELGGMQLPYVVEKAVTAWFTAANVATYAYLFLTVSNANTLLKCATPRQVARFVQPLFDGRFFGTMALSEPQAGSSLSDIATRAEPDPIDGPEGERQYRLFGNKMWISGGEHDLAGNIVHLVLAKIPGSDGKLIPGVKGISLFIVPKFILDDNGAPAERNDVVLAGLNHKMGNRGTTNTLLNFGEGKFTPGGKAGAIGYLVGAPHQGLANMFHMMNEARIGVGLGAAALGVTGYLHALDYARNRPQGRHPAEKNPAQPQVPIIAHPDVRRMLLAQKAYAEGALALVLYCAKLVDEQRTGTPGAQAHAGRLLDFLTPVAKSWPSQWCVEANSLAIQVHGGYGYTRDYPVEQFYRDNRLNAIHEGTHGIHGLDLLGRKVTQQDGALMRALATEIAATVAAARSDAQLSGYADALAAAWARVETVTTQLYGAGDLAVTLANASLYLEAVGHAVLAWIWLDMATSAVTRLATAADPDFYQGKLQACRYFYVWELPKIGQQLDVLGNLDTTALAMRPEWF